MVGWNVLTFIISLLHKSHIYAMEKLGNRLAKFKENVNLLYFQNPEVPSGYFKVEDRLD